MDEVSDSIWGTKNPIINIHNDKINESNISPIVIGSLRYLKLMYINREDTQTNIDEISKIFITKFTKLNEIRS